MEHESQFFPSMRPAKRSLVPRHILWILNLALLFFQWFWLILSMYIKLFWVTLSIKKKCWKLGLLTWFLWKRFMHPFFQIWTSLLFFYNPLLILSTQHSASSRGTKWHKVALECSSERLLGNIEIPWKQHENHYLQQPLQANHMGWNVLHCFNNPSTDMFTGNSAVSISHLLCLCSINEPFQ